MSLHDDIVVESKFNCNENGNESENLSQAFVDVVKWYLIVNAQSDHVRKKVKSL